MNNKPFIDKFKYIFNKKLINYLNVKTFSKIQTYYTITHEKLLIRLKLLNQLFKFNFFNNYNNNNNKFFQYVNNFKTKNKFKQSFLLTSATYCSASFYHKFSWDDYRISNDELKNFVNELLNEFGKSNDNNDNSHLFNESYDNEKLKNGDNDWEKIFSRHDLIIWRRKLFENCDENDEDKIKSQLVKKQESQLPFIYEYKVFGRLYDVTAIDFFRTQIDLNYRKKWDHLVIKLQVMSTDKKFLNQTSELLQWIMKYPFPMNSREYIFVRRFCVEPERGLLILVSKSITNPNINFIDDDAEDENTEAVINHPPHNNNNKSNHQCQEKIENYNKFDEKKSQQKISYEQPHQQAPYVRVTKYKSNMIIMSHKNNFYELGLDFILHYYDDPKARIPNMAYKWMATSGLPDWLDKLHKATKNIQKPNKPINVNEDYELFYLKEIEIKKTDSNEPHSPDTNKNLTEIDDKIDNSKVTDEKATTTTTTTSNNNQQNQENEIKKKPKRIHHSDTEPHPSGSFY